MEVFDYRENLIGSYRDYVSSFFKISDPEIREFVEKELAQGRLWPDPLIQLNPGFHSGGWIDDLVSSGILHQDCSQIFRREKGESDTQGKPLRLHQHQKEAILKAREGRNYVLTTGTGSGKSLAYIVPVIDHVLRHPDQKGIKAIIIYPMNALANSQYGELKKFLDFGNGKLERLVTFERYTGQDDEITRKRIISDPPDILLTNYVMLELILTRGQEAPLVEAARGLKFLVLDEMHTYRGRQGADVAMLLRRLHQTIDTSSLQFVGTSATIAGKGTWADQQKEVSTLATRLFGVDLEPSDIVGETLERICDTFDFEDGTVIEQIRAEISAQESWNWSSPEKFISSPLASWVEEAFGVSWDHSNNKLIRSKAKSIPLPKGAAARLSDLTGLPPDSCETAIKSLLLAGSTNLRHPDTGFPLFAFRLHQFISRGDTIYSSIESEGKRFLTTEGQKFVPGDRDKLLFPLAFCRECGQEHYTIFLEKDRTTGASRLSPREASDSVSLADRQPGFLYHSKDKPWPASEDEQGILDRLPQEWLEIRRDKPAIMDSRKPKVPRLLKVSPDGTMAGDGLTMAYMPTPFAFCPNCGVSYDAKQRSDFSKLATLGSEGRSTATTILTTSAVSELMRDPETPERARKLLSFTDNRQDASLQAGHLNDFVEVSMVRGALYQAVLAAGEAGLSDELISQRVFENINLPPDNYSQEPGLKYAARERVDRVFRDVIGYHVYFDLRRGWRVNAPNLEQCGLLRIEYSYLEEICTTDSEWALFHPLLQSLSSKTRTQICRVLLDFIRRDLCIDVDYLQPESQDALKRRSVNDLRDPWRLEIGDQLTRAFPAFPCIRSGIQQKGTFISPKGAFGFFLRSPGRFIQGKRISVHDTTEILPHICEVLRRAGILKQVITKGVEAPEAGYLINPSAILWKVGDGTEPYYDPIRMPSRAKERSTPNAFFVDFYRNQVSLMKSIRAKEHTAQVPPEKRQDRERDFAEAKLPILFCSPTMELGIDIKELNVVNMRNVPPTPANYAQRSGRAGRSGQPAFVFTYCAFGSPHDQFFFRRPEQMVSGQVSTPRLDLGNEDLIRSHIHAIWLQGARLNLGKTPAELVELSGEDPSLKLKQSIRTALLDENFRDQALERGTALLAAMGKHLKDAPWYHDAWLREVLAHLESSFNTAMERWRFLYKAARSQARTQDRIIRDHTISTIQREVAERLRREAEQQLNLLCDASTTAQSDFYTYRYLASEGFLPGYNFPRLPLSAFIPGRRGIKGEEEFLSRPRFLAISEFGPGALIYHEGSRYQVTRVMMPVGTDNEIETLGLKICDTCGYLHPLKDGYKPDVCERCTSKLETTLPGLFRMQNVRTQRRQRISCDEEERLRLGYEIKTGVRFAERFGHPISFKNQVTEDTDKFLDLEYGDAAVIWRINYGWSRRKEREDRGFWLDVEKRQWASNPDEEDDDLPDANTNAVLKKVIPYVEDRRNSLVIRPWGEYTPEFMASLEAALKRAIQVSFHLEDSELATETLPSRDNRREILFYEASEGGAGVLRQLVTDTSVWSRLADVALDLLHYHPESGEDLQHAPHAKERCESACYDCLKSYGNQSDHSLLDRRLLREFLLALRSCSLNNPDPTSKGKSLEFQPTSTVAKQFCGFLLKYQLRVPEIGTPLSDCDASPDFIFKDRDNPTVIYIDGNESPREPQQDSILENKGFTVLRFGSLESWMPGIQRYPSIFGKPLYPETEKPKISFDPTLFSPSLISLLDSLSKISGVSINPGSDFLSEGKIVGQTLASVEKDKKLLVLVSKSEPQDLLTALQVQGTKTILIGTTPHDSIAEITHFLEEKE